VFLRCDGSWERGEMEGVVVACVVVTDSFPYSYPARGEEENKTHLKQPYLSVYSIFCAFVSSTIDQSLHPPPYSRRTISLSLPPPQQHRHDRVTKTQAALPPSPT